MELPWMNGPLNPQRREQSPQPGQQSPQPDQHRPQADEEDGAGTVAFVMGSRFELRSRWRSPVFLLLAMRVWRQARRSRGLLGVSLRAHPVSGVFWTLSAWTDEASLREFARTDPHRTIMKRARPWTKSSTFRFWTVPAGELAPAPLWADAQRRIAALPGTRVQTIVPDSGPL
jgi:Domain of unknown function (DUF3291)